MKKLIVLLMIGWLPAILTAQDTPISSLYDRYSGDPGFESSVILPSNTSFEWEKEMDNSSLKDMMKGIERITILKYKAGGNRDVSEKLWKNIDKAASDAMYTELVNVNAEDVRVRILMIKGDGGTTREVALIGKDDDMTMLATMNGKMDFSSLFSKENMKGLCEMGEYLLKNKGGCENHEE